MCFKLLQNVDKINSQIHVIWTENQKFVDTCGEKLCESNIQI